MIPTPTAKIDRNDAMLKVACGRHRDVAHSSPVFVNFYLGNAWIEVTAEELVAVVLYTFCQCPGAVFFQYQVTLAC